MLTVACTYNIPSSVFIIPFLFSSLLRRLINHVLIPNTDYISAVAGRETKHRLLQNVNVPTWSTPTPNISVLFTCSHPHPVVKICIIILICLRFFFEIIFLFLKRDMTIFIISVNRLTHKHRDQLFSKQQFPLVGGRTLLSKRKNFEILKF